MADANIQLLVVSCLLMLTGCLGHSNKHAALFVFGDSLLDSGNNNYINTTTDFQANFWPYGISYFNPPSGRFSDGRLIHDFIAEYANLPLIPTYLDPRNNDFVYGANFASGGAGALVETHAGFVVNLKTQLHYFGDLEKHFRQTLGDAKTDQLLSDAVYLFSCGGNDYVAPVGNNSVLYAPYTYEQYVEMVIENFTDVFKGIYEKGGRKFGVLTVPPLACLPNIRAGRAGHTCNQELDVITSLHNQKLSIKLEELETQLEGFIYSKFDIYTEVNNRMKNPSRYGIYSCGGKRGVQEFQLCENVDEYLFFDSFHPNEVASAQYAKLFWNGKSSVTTPYNLKTLFQFKKH
ncbi:putative GDSL lipase/esterase, SGNH hydrolase superfamily [Helianthus annuus]|nr:putative GDSL lipase/esterase, SGNH hydrolase superfamily, GDSL esterase/lipase GLIP1-5/GLL25 [Helianthus annuus]KAJ0759535.1 putative GDSL lipase/esterase, SGNH hydrolase superfamily [Helianthus annuus]